MQIKRSKTVVAAKAKSRPFVSVVVPVGQGDESWKTLLGDLVLPPFSLEIILVGPEFSSSFNHGFTNLPVRFFRGSGDRAQQLNFGAQKACGEFVWFLHSDSRITTEVLMELHHGLLDLPAAFHFFSLQFLSDGPKMTAINSFCANWRSRHLGIPFGDQGFCLAQRLWHQSLGFPLGRSYGEDHAFVWQLKRKKIPFCFHKAAIKTSARKYEQKGWWNTTCRHLALTWSQAYAEWRIL